MLRRSRIYTGASAFSGHSSAIMHFCVSFEWVALTVNIHITELCVCNIFDESNHKNFFLIPDDLVWLKKTPLDVIPKKLVTRDELKGQLKDFFPAKATIHVGNECDAGKLARLNVLPPTVGRHAKVWKRTVERYPSARCHHHQLLTEEQFPCAKEKCFGLKNVLFWKRREMTSFPATGFVCLDSKTDPYVNSPCGLDYRKLDAGTQTDM